MIKAAKQGWLTPAGMLFKSFEDHPYLVPA
jgi:hypothetical protein